MHPQVYAIAVLDLHTANCKTCRFAMFGGPDPVPRKMCPYGQVLDRVARRNTKAVDDAATDIPG